MSRSRATHTLLGAVGRRRWLGSFGRLFGSTWDGTKHLLMCMKLTGYKDGRGIVALQLWAGQKKEDHICGQRSSETSDKINEK